MALPPLKVINPYDQEVVCELSWDEGNLLNKKIADARHAYEIWRHVPIDERIRIIRQGLERFRSNAGKIAKDITVQMGKPLQQARREVETFFERAEYMISIARESLAPDILPSIEGFHRRIEHAPLGIVLNIAAWNYPLLIPVNVVIPALLAGNTVLLKHSAKTPLCGQHFESAFGKLEPSNLVTHLVLTHDQTSRLLEDNRINYVAFTGSVPGGSHIYRQAAKRFLDVGLELGGKDPAYVAEDADIDFSVENIVDGACYNAGQSCCAVERVYVHHKLYNEFLSKAKTVLESYRLGDPLDDQTTMGPLASRSALEILERQIKDGISRGGRLLLGGKRLEGVKGNFFLPALLADVPNDAEAMQEESFGPLVPVMAAANDEEALSCMADSRYGLTASVWTSSRERAERFARDLEAGTIYQNRCDYLDPALPWTGMRDSGMGSTLSRYGFYHLTKRKSVHFKRRT
ncbi:MAG: aldehyde dehydrogenase family protein [Nitrospirae bacterium]|nr:aldehyde dehydrogenase family protein [Nitrospirota bacterium]